MKRYMYVLQSPDSMKYSIGTATAKDIPASRRRLEAKYGKMLLTATKRIDNDDIMIRIDNTYRKSNNQYEVPANGIDDLLELPNVMKKWATNNPNAVKTDAPITLYALVNYVNNITGKTLEHGKVLKKVRRWMQLEAFGACAQIGERINYPDSKRGDIILNTVELSPRQCIAVAGSISMAVELAVIDRLKYMEDTYDPTYVTEDHIRLGAMDEFNNVTLLGLCNHIQNTFNCKVRHSDLMRRKVRGWMNTIGFGILTKVKVNYSAGNGAKVFTHTYELTPRQALAIAGSISMSVQLIIIDRLRDLELEFEPNNVTETRMARAIAIYAAYVADQSKPKHLRSEGPAGVLGAGVFIEKRSSDGHLFCYKPGHYIANPSSDNPVLTDDVHYLR